MRSFGVCSVACLAALVIVVVAPQSAATVACSLVPYGGTAVVDGNNSEWNHTVLPATGEMYWAWNTSGTVLSEFWLRYDCNSHMMYVLVMSQYRIDPGDGEETYVQCSKTGYSTGAKDENGDIEWVRINNVIYGWEAAFSLIEGTFSLTIHNNVWVPGASGNPQTSGLSSATLCVDCTSIGITLRSFGADPFEQGIRLTWEVEKELNHAGYNLYRSAADNKEFVKINPALIVAESGDGHYEYLDTQAPAGQNYYKLEEISLDGLSTFYGPVLATITSGVTTNRETVTDYALAQNYPNPFNPTTTISYTIPQAQFVSLDIYDLTGRRVRTLVESEQAAGQHTVQWDATNDYGETVPSGLYIYKMSAGEFQKTARMVLLK